MRITAEVLRAVLRSKGVPEDDIQEILAVAQARSSQSRTRRARLVAEHKVDDATLEKWRQEQLLKEWERSVRRKSEFYVTGVTISPTRSVAIFRQHDEIVLAELRHTVVRSAPFNRRQLFQKLPPVRTERCELLRLVISTPERTGVLAVVGRQKGVPLPERERQWLYRSLSGEVMVRCGKWQITLPKGDWKQTIVAWRHRYPLIANRWEVLEVSSDGEKWFKVARLVTIMMH